MNYYYLFIPITSLFIISEIFPFCSKKYSGIFHFIIYKILISNDKIINTPIFTILENEDMIKSNNDFENQV